MKVGIRLKADVVAPLIWSRRSMAQDFICDPETGNIVA
jgi:hypothetical protein